MHNATFSVLEPRMFLHGHSVVVDPAVLEAARAAVMSSLATLQEHYATNKAAVDSARQMLVQNRMSWDVQVQALRAELQSDKAMYKVELKQAKADLQSVRSIWQPIIAAGELDVYTDTEGETEEERAADLAKLETDRETFSDAKMAAYAAIDDTRARWDAEIDADVDAIDDARYAAKKQLRDDERAVKSAQRTMKSVFQSDRVILFDAIDDYRDAGGKTKHLKLPKLSSPC